MFFYHSRILIHQEGHPYRNHPSLAASLYAAELCPDGETTKLLCRSIHAHFSVGFAGLRIGADTSQEAINLLNTCQSNAATCVSF